MNCTCAVLFGSYLGRVIYDIGLNRLAVLVEEKGCLRETGAAAAAVFHHLSGARFLLTENVKEVKDFGPHLILVLTRDYSRLEVLRDLPSDLLFVGKEGEHYTSGDVYRVDVSGCVLTLFKDDEPLFQYLIPACGDCDLSMLEI